MKSLLFIGLGVAVIVAACTVAFVAKGKKQEPPKPAEVHYAPVKVVPASLAFFGEWTDLLGTTQPLPNQIARISAPVEGRILSILGDGKSASLAEGDHVKANQVVAQFDDSVPRAYRDRLAVALLDLDLQLKQNQTAMERADREVKQLEESLQGKQSNSSTSAATPPDLEKARAARADIQSRQSTALAWQAVVQAEMKAIDAVMQFYSIKSPIAGQLGMIQVTPGQAVTAGTTLAEVINLDEIDVLCFVPPHVVSKLALGQTARLDPHDSTTGEVAFIAVQADADTGNFAVKVRFHNVDGKLKSNSVRRLQVQTQPEKTRIAIPEDALLEDQASPVVMVASKFSTIWDEHLRAKKVAKARKLLPMVGVRSRDQQLVEITRLYDADTGQRVSLKDILFITNGANGLHVDDNLYVTGDLLPRDEVKELEKTALKVLRARAVLEGQSEATKEGKKYDPNLGHKESVWSLAFSPDGKMLASGSVDKAIILWDAVTGKKINTLGEHSTGALSLAISPDGKLLASAGPNGALKLWYIAASKDTVTIQAHKKGVTSLSFSPDGKLLATGSFDGAIKVWDVAELNGAAKKDAELFARNGRPVASMSFSADSKSIAWATTDNVISVADLASGKNTIVLRGQTARATALSFSPDGKTLASWSAAQKKDGSGTGKGELRFWDLATGKNTKTMEGYSSGGKGTFSPDGKLLAWIDDNGATVWDVATGKEIAALEGHSGAIAALTFSPDGKTLATGSLDRSIRLWEVPTAK